MFIDILKVIVHITIAPRGPNEGNGPTALVLYKHNMRLSLT